MTNPANDQSRKRTAAASRFFGRMRRLRRLLRRYWWVAALSMALAMGAAYALIVETPPSFFSVGQMTVNMKLSGTTTPLYMEELYNFLGTQAALLKGDTVANRARLRLQTVRPNLHPCLVKLQAVVSPKTSIFNLRADGADPDYTQAWLDGCMEEYMSLKRQMRKSTSDTAISGVSDELVRLDNEIRQGKEDLINFSASNSVVLLQGNSAANYLDNLNRRLADARLESQLLKMLTLDENVRRQEERARQNPVPDKGQNAAASAPAPAGTAEAGNSVAFNPSRPTLTGPEGDYLKADQQIQLMKAELRDLSQYLRPKHPKIIALTEDIARTERLLEIFRQQSGEQLASREHSLEIEILNDEAEVKTWKEKAIEDSKVLATYQSLKDNSQHLQDMYNSLVATSRTIDVDKEISPETVTILEPATDPRPVPPNVPEKMTLAGIGGFILALGILLWRDRMDDRPTSLIEVQALFDEPVLGQIPLVRSAKRRAPIPPIQPDDDRHAFKEAYCNLRSALLYMESGGPRPKQILITSAIPNDGKSMTAANLAITLAEAGSVVLLIDADLRRGSLHQLFSVPADPGLATILSGEAGLADGITVTSIPNLSFLPRGTADRSPGRLFLGPEADAFLAAIREYYDFIIFDTAPIVAADDVSNLAPKMDGVIMVIRANHTPGRVARAAIELLYLRQVKVLGLVFNAIEAAFNEYYYYNYPAYYHQPRKTAAVSGSQVNAARPPVKPAVAEEIAPEMESEPAALDEAESAPPEDPAEPEGMVEASEPEEPVDWSEPAAAEILEPVEPEVEPVAAAVAEAQPQPEMEEPVKRRLVQRSNAGKSRAKPAVRRRSRPAESANPPGL